MEKKNNLLLYLTVLNSILLAISLVILSLIFFSTGRKSAAHPNEAPKFVKTGIDMGSLEKGAFYKGSENPKNTVVVFNSFTCGFCRKSSGVLKQLTQKYKDIKIVYKHYNRNDIDVPAGVAAECSGQQGKFWEMYDLLFSKGPQSDYSVYATELNLDKNKFNVCMKSSELVKKTGNDTDQGRELGINGTPSFVINGNLSVGYRPLEEFEKLLN